MIQKGIEFGNYIYFYRSTYLRALFFGSFISFVHKYLIFMSMRKLTLDEFILKAKHAHGGKYDYSKFVRITHKDFSNIYSGLSSML
jgi:hypothetical protein